MKQSKNLQWIIMLITWMCIFILPFLYFPYNREFSPLRSVRFLHWYIYSDIFLLLFYFANNALLVPHFLSKKKVGYYVLVMVALFLLYLYGFNLISQYSRESKEFIQFRRKHNLPWLPKSLLFFSPGAIILFLVTLILSSGNSIVQKWMEAEKIKEEVNKQKLETELAMLKSQVNPHFLFNTLNSIYTLALMQDENAANAVMKLSKIMRFTLEKSQNDSIPLSEELDFLDNYINLQQLRLTDATKINYQVAGNIKNIKLPPLLFISMIENAFKYGVSAHQASEISIHFTLNEDRQLIFVCTNSILKQRSETEGASSGIANLKRRLELLYAPEDFELHTSVTADNLFEAYLRLNIAQQKK